MADSIQGTDSLARPNFPHDWLDWDEYYKVHLSYMRTLERKQFVIADTLSFEHIKNEHGDLVLVHVYGLIECSDDVILDVDKWLDSDGSAVRGADYAYHAYVVRDNSDRRPVLRYDNAHGPFHCHIFDLETGDGTETELARDEFPTLDRVIQEAVMQVRRARLS